MDTAARPLAVGYLHLGANNHGVRRFGEHLARAAAEHPMLRVSEASISWGQSERRNTRLLLDAARTFRGADLVHVQYNGQRDKSIWGRGLRQLYHLAIFIYACGKPIVVSVHDTYPRVPLSKLIRDLPSRLLLRIKPRSRMARVSSVSVDRSEPALSSHMKRLISPDALALQWLHRRARKLIVCSTEEKGRLDAFFGRPAVRVIPHFVEHRTLPSVDRAGAKAHVGLSERRVVTVLGFIHPRKGHRLLIDALTRLPDDVFAVFAGGARDDCIVAELHTHAVQLGVASRIRVTGYLDEASLGYYLAATDLAVCPFADVAASSSLATWISAATPVLASELPLIAEYNRIERGAIRVFAPYTASALASGILEALNTADNEVDCRIRRLQRHLNAAGVIEQHRLLYEEAVKS